MAIDETSVRIHLPQSLLEQVRAYQLKHGMSNFSMAVIQALEEFFNTSDTPTYAPLDRLEAVEATVKDLTYQIALLNQQMVNQQLLNQQTSQQLVNPSGMQSFNQSFIAPGKLPHTLPLTQPVSYEDVEDEPDEILWDFMPPEGPP